MPIRESELRERRQPRPVEVDAMRTKIIHHGGDISQHEVRQELLVQRTTPADQRRRVRHLGEPGDECLYQECWNHPACGGISKARSSSSPSRPRRASGL